MPHKPKEKIKPSYVTWYERDFAADERVRYLRPMARHFYRALIIQSFFCSARPYLPDDDGMLWKLADADSEQHWMEYAVSVREMFTPVTVRGTKLLQQGRIISEWKKMEKIFSGKSNGTKELRPKVGEGSTSVVHPRTETDQNGPEDPTPEQPENRATQKSTTTTEPENRTQNTDPDFEQASAVQGTGSGSVASSSDTNTNRPDKNNPSSGEKRDGSIAKQKTTPVGNGKPVTAKAQGFLDDEEKPVAQGTSSGNLVARFWLIANKKPGEGAYCGEPNMTWDGDNMKDIVSAHGIQKVVLALDHLQRSDYWGCDEKGKLNGILGFGKALEAIYAQAQRYLEKVKETAKAAKT